MLLTGHFINFIARITLKKYLKKNENKNLNMEFL